MRLSFSPEEALCLLWALEEALLIAEPEEEELLSSLIQRLSVSASYAPFSSASQRRRDKLSRPVLPGEALPPLSPHSHSVSLPL